ncbi:MAG: hypothetical protein KatS3mg033_1333 [Thermonema sp.]|jgi:hypothetical protein|uniref:hypothetical protein n=1 Tax=Thermonema TaxID=28194 RepID=UPI00056E0BBE|nr:MULTISPECIES: hypothetical protein [Thermonema]GIV39533.1 MAG: hypothetical protein KatS3mg033_1333 [Thermonema sp.]
MKKLAELPPVPFTVRMHDLRNLEEFGVTPNQLYTVVKVLEVNGQVVGYRLLEIPLAEDEVFNASRFYIYAIANPN